MDKGDTLDRLDRDDRLRGFRRRPHALGRRDCQVFHGQFFRYTLPPRVSSTRSSSRRRPSRPTPRRPTPRSASTTTRTPGKFPVPTAGKAPAKPDPGADYILAQPQARAALVAELEKRSAVKAASDLAYALYDGKVTRASLDSFLATRKLKARSLAPFTSEAGPAEFGGSKEIAAAAVRPRRRPVLLRGRARARSGAVVLIWKDTLPSREPALAEVLEKVRADATDNQKRIRFAEFGRTLKVGIERGLKAGETLRQGGGPGRGLRQGRREVLSPVHAARPAQGRRPGRVPGPGRPRQGRGLRHGGHRRQGRGGLRGRQEAARDRRVQPALRPVRAQIANSFATADETSITREFVDTELKRTDPNAK
jgi:peptidyl-prolyl cis-trans isomerase D